jgi:hypothetical protein
MNAAALSHTDIAVSFTQLNAETNQRDTPARVGKTFTFPFSIRPCAAFSKKGPAMGPYRLVQPLVSFQVMPRSSRFKARVGSGIRIDLFIAPLIERLK